MRWRLQHTWRAPANRPTTAPASSPPSGAASHPARTAGVRWPSCLLHKRAALLCSVVLLVHGRRGCCVNSSLDFVCSSSMHFLCWLQGAASK